MSAVAEGATLEALDFSLLVRALASQAQTPMGRAALEAIKPSARRDWRIHVELTTVERRVRRPSHLPIAWAPYY